MRIDDLGDESLGIVDIEQTAGVVADELDQRGHPQRSADVIHVQHEHGDACQHQDVADGDGHTGNLTVAFELHFADRDHRMSERRHEQPDRQLARPIAQERLHDPRRELPHRQLHHDHRDRQHQRRQRHHRHRDRRQNRQRRVWATRHPRRNHLETETTIDGHRPQRQHDPAEHAHHRNEPQGRTHTCRRRSHQRSLPVLDGNVEPS